MYAGIRAGHEGPAIVHLSAHREFLRADPFVFWELNFKLDEQVSLLKGVAVMWHPLTSHNSD